MLSYPWFYQPVAKDLCRKLREQGYKVWIDVDNMSGNLLEGMATAVENAAVVVMFICEKYKESNNCRAEAEYAFQLQKDIVSLMLACDYSPDGWLGILLGKKLFIDFCHPENLQDSWQRLLRELSNRGRADDSQENEVSVTPSPARKSVCVSHLFDASYSKEDIILWKCVDVQNWLTRVGLAKFSKRFKELDGSLILELKDLQRSSPEFFNYSLTQQFHFTLRESRAFTVLQS